MRRRPSVVALLTGVTLLAACGGTSPGGWTDDRSGRTGLGEVPATDLGFVRHADAVQWPSASDFVPPGEGLRMLLPDGDCVRAIGTFRTATAG